MRAQTHLLLKSGSSKCPRITLTSLVPPASRPARSDWPSWRTPASPTRSARRSHIFMPCRLSATTCAKFTGAPWLISTFAHGAQRGSRLAGLHRRMSTRRMPDSSQRVTSWLLRSRYFRGWSAFLHAGKGSSRYAFCRRASREGYESSLCLSTCWQHD